MSLSQTSVSFGNVTLGTATAPQVVYLANLGAQGTTPININGLQLGGTNAGDFTFSQTCGGTLGFSIAGRQTCEINVAFAPTAAASRVASLTITPASGNPLVIQLMGTGTPAAAVMKLPSAVKFAATRLGSASAPQTITVKNDGTAPLTIGRVLSTQPAEFTVVTDDCSHHAVAAGGACDMSMSFTAQTPGAHSATFAVMDEAGHVAQTVALTGTGAKMPQRISFDQAETGVSQHNLLRLPAVATSRLPVHYDVIAGPGVVEKETLRFTGPGVVLVRATQQGDEIFAPAAQVEHAFRSPLICAGECKSKE